MAGSGSIHRGLRGVPGDCRTDRPRHGFVIRRGSAGRQRCVVVERNVIAGLPRRCAGRRRVLFPGTPFPSEHPAPARAAPSPGVDCRGRVILPALRHCQPAGRAFHWPLAAHAADGRRDVRHAIPTLLRCQPASGGGMVGSVSTAGLGHRRGDSLAVARRLLAAGGHRRRQYCSHGGTERDQQPASPPQGHDVHCRHECSDSGRVVYRLSVPDGPRPGGYGPGTGTPQPDAR